MQVWGLPWTVRKVDPKMKTVGNGGPKKITGLQPNGNGTKSKPTVLICINSNSFVLVPVTLVCV